MAQKEHAAQPPSRLSMESTPAAKLIGARRVASGGKEEVEDPKGDWDELDPEDEASDGGETETRILIDQALVNTVEDPDEEEAVDTLLDDFRLETQEALEDDGADAAEQFMPQLDTLDPLDDDAEQIAVETILLDELAPMSFLEDEPAAISGEDPALVEIPTAFPDDDDGADDEPDRELVIEPLLDSSAKAAPAALHLGHGSDWCGQAQRLSREHVA